LAAGFFLLIQQVATAQEQEPLSSDNQKFFNQISAILLSTPSDTYKKRSEALLDRFFPTWNVDRFSVKDRAEIRKLIETMRAHKMKTYPYLYKYIYALTLLGESQLPSKSIIAWHMYAEKLLTQKQSAPFGKLLDFTRVLLEEQKLQKKGSFGWYYRRAKYTLDLDTALVVRFEYLDLVCASGKDSSVIEHTAGYFNYESKMWRGSKGLLTWGRFGEEKGKEIYADFGDYSIDLQKTTYRIDSALLHYERFFKHPVLGRLSDKIMAGPPGKRTSYPRFKACLDNYEIENIYKDVDYLGGIRLEGLKIIGAGTEGNDALVIIRHNDTIFGRVEAEEFLISDLKIEAKDARASFYFGRDSLFHPQIHLRYSIPDNRIMLFNDEVVTKMPPFIDTYHQLLIYSEALYWNVDSTGMYFKNMQGVNRKNKASFISNNYFSEKTFYQIQGMDDINPLYTIYNYLHTYDDKEIHVNSLAQLMRKPREQVVALLINLERKGFLVYDSKTGTAVPEQRMFDFLDAKAGAIDYDVIRLESNVYNKPNARLNLKNYSLDVFGVPEVFISDSQEVYIYPFDKTISFKKNRDFTFDGRVHAGLFDFYAQNSTFIYDSFMLNLNYIDSLSFKVKAKSEYSGEDSLVKVRNVLMVLNGRIYIDEPDNKSGLKQLPKYPIFVSNEESYVYFNKRGIQDSTLLPESFYYRVEPFVFDSLSTFTTEGLSFKGNLSSAGIFPTIHEPLVVTEDYSLGFVHHTPPEGYEVYGGKARFTSEIKLSNEGFEGDGTLKYLTATTASDKFMFYPDSLTGTARYFTLNESPDKYDFPGLRGDSVDISWDVDTNLMAIRQLYDPFIIYHEPILNGNVALSPEDLKGNGSFLFDQSEIISDNINFKFNELTADSADFYLRLKNSDTVVFRAKDYFARIDFQQHMGWFDNLSGDAFIEFPFNKYYATLDEIEWVMDESRLELRSALSADMAKLDELTYEDMIDNKSVWPEFVSVHPQQDSLRFFTAKASYNLSSYTIDAEGVRMIRVADAAIFPGNEAVKIMRDAKMDTLINAQIVVDTNTKYHHIYDAGVSIFGRHQYMAQGYVDYTDRMGTKQPVYLTSISADSEGRTFGYGEISADDIFFLSPEYFFMGKVSLIADRKNYRFTGGYKINEECIGLVDNWVSFDQFLDPQNLYFNMTDTTRDMKGRRARFGLAYSEREKNFYPMVLQAKKDSADFVLIQASGQIDYDKDKNLFRVSSAQRLQEGVLTDNLVALNNERCILEGDGVLDLGLNFNMLDWKAVGKFKHLIYTDSTYLNTVLSLNFFMDPVAMGMMVDSLRISYADDLDVANSLFPIYLQRVAGPQKASEIMTELSLYGQMKKMPHSLDHAIIFTDLKLKWDPKTRSYLSYGKIGIGYIAGMAVNKYVDGYMQIEMGRTGSGIHFFLKVSNDSWYFFSYKHGIMQVISSDNAFNELIANLKQEKRVLNPNSDTDYYEFVISTRRKSVDFVRKMETLMRQ
jgi:hypothetical protein